MATRRLPGREVGTVRELRRWFGMRAAKVFCGSAVSRVLRVERWGELDAAGGAAGCGADGGGLPGGSGEYELPAVSRGAGGAAGDAAIRLH